MSEISESNMDVLKTAVDDAVAALRPVYKEADLLREKLAALRVQYKAALESVVKTFLRSIDGAKTMIITASVTDEYNDEGGTYEVIQYGFCIQNAEEEDILKTGALDFDIQEELEDLLEDAFTVSELRESEFSYIVTI